MSDYPEHDKLHAVKDKSQAIGEFVEWLQEQGIHLASWHNGTQLRPWHESIEDLLARHFEIDLAKLEAEKRAMLDKIRGAQ